MIASLRGTVQYIDVNYIELAVGDIAYLVYVPTAESASLHIEGEAFLYIHTHVREEAFDLYGFSDRTRKTMFEHLLSVSGIGPKSALGVLSAATIEELESAIVRGDSKILEKVSGIGKKTAQKIVLELQSKYKSSVPIRGEKETSYEDSDVIEALIGLGYTADDARAALRAIDSAITGTDAKLKACLQQLAR